MLRPGFTLRAMLAVAVVCAVGIAFAYWFSAVEPPAEVRKVRFGMTRAHVLHLFGQPADVRFDDERETWRFNFEWGLMDVQFLKREDCCVGHGYKRAD